MEYFENGTLYFDGEELLVVGHRLIDTEDLASYPAGEAIEKATVFSIGETVTVADCGSVGEEDDRPSQACACSMDCHTGRKEKILAIKRAKIKPVTRTVGFEIEEEQPDWCR